MSGEVEKIHVRLGERSYDIAIGESLFSGASAPLHKYVDGKRVLVIGDSNTGALFGETVLESVRRSALSAELFTFPAGEESKTFETVVNMARACVRARLDRGSMIVALGGGVTGDLAGLAAALYMRGIDFIQLPTSLLAMIDSSVGGKTGADLPEGKNLIGAFHQPRAVFMDVSFLRSLPVRELSCGFAELVKHAVLFDPELFSRLEEESQVMMGVSDLKGLSRVIATSCALKARVVSADERETGTERALLNLGHSFGHALEKTLDYKGILHGEAVSWGMAVACTLSESLGFMREAERVRTEGLLKAYSLPVMYRVSSAEELVRAMASDKKNLADAVRIVIPRRIGHASVETNISPELVLDSVRRHILQ